MAQAKRYLILSLNYIQPTIQAKSLWIPGKTCAFDVTVNGEQAFYYENESFQIIEQAAGDKLDLSTTGAKRKSFDMDRAYGLGGIVPLVGHATVTEDIIGDKLVSSAEGVIALDNQKGLAAMLATGKHTESKLPLANKPTSATIYGLIIDDIVKFKKDNKVVIDKTTNRAKGGWQPKTVIVGSEGYGLLQKSDEFVKHNADFTVNEAYVGKVAGLDVVYSPDLDSADWIVMSPEGFLAPKGVSATEVFDKIEGRPGAVLAQAEMVYGFEVIDPKQILVHTTDSK